MIDIKVAAEYVANFPAIPEAKRTQFEIEARKLARYVLSLPDKGAEETAREMVMAEMECQTPCAAPCTCSRLTAALAATAAAAEARVRGRYEPNADDVAVLQKALAQLGVVSPPSMEELGLGWLSYVRLVNGILARKVQKNAAPPPDPAQDREALPILQSLIAWAKKSNDPSEGDNYLNGDSDVIPGDGRKDLAEIIRRARHVVDAAYAPDFAAGFKREGG